MNLKRTTKFLGAFSNAPVYDPSALGFVPPALSAVPPAPPAPAPAPQARPTSGMVPVEAVIDLAEAIRRRDEARQTLQRVQAPPPPPPPQQQVAPLPEPIPAVPPPNNNDDLARELRQLTQSNRQLAAQLKQQQLETYRATAIANARAAGHELIDALVYGNSPAEIDATLSVAVAEYKILEGNFQKKFQQQVSVAAPPPGPPAATVTSTAVAASQQPANQPNANPSVPGFVSAPNVAPVDDQGMPQEYFNYLTSGEAIRNGDYAKNRHLIHQQLRRGAAGPEGRWAFNPGYSISAPFPQPSQQPPQPVGYSAAPPAMMPESYAGVSMPTVRTSAPASYPRPGMPPGVAARGYATAPQPSQFQNDHGQGNYSPNGVSPTQGDVASARQAAMNSLGSARGQYGPSIHGQ